jgi:RAP1 GTPase activating protein 1
MPQVATAKVQGVHESLLQECEKDVLWYRDNFLGKGI